MTGLRLVEGNFLKELTALASEVYLVTLDGKGINEILPEPHEVIGDISLVVDQDVSLGETGSNWLIDVDDIREFVPTVSCSEC